MSKFIDEINFAYKLFKNNLGFDDKENHSEICITQDCIETG